MLRDIARGARNQARETQKELAKLPVRWMGLRFGLPTVTLESIAGPDVELAPAILDDVCMPPYVGPSDHDDFTPLMKIARAVNPRVIVELGTAYGNTVANLCNQLPACRVYTVNAPLELQTGAVTTYSLERDEIGRAYRRYGFDSRVVQIFENTLDLDLSRYFNRPCVNLAIIDACHDTAYVINDFLKVQPFMDQGGVILLHDTHPSMKEHLIGSYAACLQLRSRGFDIRHVAHTWWGIWQKTD